ncbi:hypothetical protein HMPREF1486_05754 [Streptomyces sp. HPH0547]|uniref:class I SAM-dependent methyltransferase n=1 Tax=Streptomyces TaxID=1883 RepID=UPI00034EB5F2|nr:MULTISPECIES: class I SAM-dependent methyltransferase [Streptomyces]EPD90720.1 hypothetical protein HMPREF1486_05754 [Streptomyces sp. HPH0547]
MTHSHTTEIDWEALGSALEREAELHLPALEAATDWLHGLLGTVEADEGGTVTRILDIGSGPGVISCLLARRFTGAEVVAVDQAPGLLRRTHDRAVAQGVGDRVTAERADLPDDLPGLGSAELIWTSHAVHHLGDQQAALDALAARLRPGGLLAVAERGLTPRFLPRDIGTGRPGLQARLDAAMEESFSEMRADLPGSVSTVEDWPAMLSGAGLIPTGSRTFLVDHPAPLGAAGREHLHHSLTRLRGMLATHLAEEDLTTLDALVDPDAPTGILWRPDAFYLTATTVHTARACAH